MRPAAEAGALRFQRVRFRLNNVLLKVCTTNTAAPIQRL